MENFNELAKEIYHKYITKEIKTAADCFKLPYDDKFFPNFTGYEPSKLHLSFPRQSGISFGRYFNSIYFDELAFYYNGMYLDTDTNIFKFDPFNTSWRPVLITTPDFLKHLAKDQLNHFYSENKRYPYIQIIRKLSNDFHIKLENYNKYIEDDNKKISKKGNKKKYF